MKEKNLYLPYNNCAMKTKEKKVSIWIDVESTKKVNKWLLAAYLTLQTAALIWTVLQDNPNARWNWTLNDAKKNLKEIVGGKFRLEKTTNDFPLNYLYPANLVAEWKEKEIEHKTHLEVPYNIAHNFDLADVLDEKNYALADSIVQAEIQKTILEEIVWFEFVKKERSEKTTPSELTTEVVLDSVGGYSSPEAAKYWDASLIPWNKEAENINLAKNIRGDDAKSRVLRAFNEIMKKHPDLASNIDTTSVQIVWDELQLQNMQEYKELASMAVRLWYPSIVEMLADYNIGKIKNKSDVTRIDELIGSKRKIMIAFTLIGKEKTVIVFPIFLPILLLIPFVRIIKRQPPVFPEPKGKKNNNKQWHHQEEPVIKWYSTRPISRKTPRLHERANENHSFRWKRGTDSRTGRKTW